MDTATDTLIDFLEAERLATEAKLANATAADNTRAMDFYRGQLHAFRTIAEHPTH